MMTKTRRPGFTLVEMNVCIFVVIVGLSGVIAMFPIGAKWMGDALTTDRMTTHALSMEGLVRNEWKIKVVENGGGNEPYWNALDDPGTHPLPSPTGTAVTRIAATSPEPSYPVFLDPMGWQRPGANRDWVGEPAAPTFVPRRSMNLIGANGALALRMWSQADGFAFDEAGYPVGYAAGSPAEMRELRYNALAVLQRPTNRDRYRATLKIVVFTNRRHQFFPAGSEATFTGILFTPNSTQITLPLTADIKQGTWVMDATVDPSAGAGKMRHANFYRVVSATDNGTVVGGVAMYDVELHTPIKRTDGGTAPYGLGTAAAPVVSSVVIMTGAREVFEMPVLTGSINP